MYRLIVLLTISFIFLPVWGQTPETQVTGFILVDTDTDTDFGPIVDGDEIDITTLPSNISIRAEVSGPVKSVVFDFDSAFDFRTENFAPYALGGDIKGNYSPTLIRLGTHSLTATPYLGPNGNGLAGISSLITFEIVEPPEPMVTGFFLVDTNTNLNIRQIADGDTISVTKLQPNISIKAEVMGPVGSVVFDFDTTLGFRTENVAPYTLGGDRNGDFFPALIQRGTHSLTATPYVGSRGTGFAGTSSLIRFTLIDIDAPVRFLTLGGDIVPKANEPEFGEPGYTNTYYGKVDPSGERTTLEDWKKVNDFIDFPHLVVNATYINAHDLGFGRNMFCLDNGRASCYVENSIEPKKQFPDVPEGELGLFAATVTMERMNFASRVITAFFVYDAKGNRTNQIALDTEGPKSVPESCYACHFGFTSAGGNPVGGQYLPWDIDLLEDWPGKPTLASQADELRMLNRIIWSDASSQYNRAIFTDPLDPSTFQGFELTNRKPSVKLLIEEWYDGSPFIGTLFNGNRLPNNEWYTDINEEGELVDSSGNTVECLGNPLPDECTRFFRERFLYKSVYAKSCRSCHAGQGEAQDVNAEFHGSDWETARSFETLAFNIVCQPGSGIPVMPHAEVTFNRFKDDLFTSTDGEVASAKDRLCAQPPQQPDDGAALYEMNCSSCHFDLEISTKKNRTFNQIKDAISIVPEMMNLNLNDDQITAIEEALK